MSSRRKFYRRRFLNRPRHHKGAYVIADVTIDSPWRADAKCHIDATLTLSDCDRVVVLDFSGDRVADWNNALHKARILRQVVCDYTEALERTIEEARSMA